MFQNINQQLQGKLCFWKMITKRWDRKSCLKQHDKAMFHDLSNKQPTQEVLSLAETLVLVCFDRESLIGWLTSNHTLKRKCEFTKARWGLRQKPILCSDH